MRTNKFVIEAAKRILSVVMYARQREMESQKYRLWYAFFNLIGMMNTPTKRSLNARDAMNTLIVIFLRVLVFRMTRIRVRLPTNATKKKEKKIVNYF